MILLYIALGIAVVGILVGLAMVIYSAGQAAGYGDGQDQTFQEVVDIHRTTYEAQRELHDKTREAFERMAEKYGL